MNTKTYYQTEFKSANTERLWTDFEEPTEVADAKPRTKYRIEEHPDGFSVKAGGRNTVRVTVSICGFQVCTFDRMDDEGQKRKWLNLYALRQLVDEVCYGTMKRWRDGKTRKDIWPVKNTKHALANRIKQQSLRLRKTLDDRVVEIHRAVFVAAWREAPCPLAVTPAALQSHFPGDVVKYRAAAIAASQLKGLMQECSRRRLDNSPELEFIKSQCKSVGYELIIRPEFPDVEAHISVNDLNSWQSLFSWNGWPYPALNRTLTNLPGGCPARLVFHLRHIRLIRPITTRLRLIAVCHAARATTTRHLEEPVNNKNVELIQNADSEQIKRAIQLVSSATGNTLSHRRASDVGEVISYLLDYPYQHNGNIVGLARRSIRWHVEIIQQRAIEIADDLGSETKCGVPEYPLPVEPGIIFLDTVGAIYTEGVEMEHCVAGYAGDAVHGDCFLFHVEHAGEAATVQMNSSGEVVQTTGPRNKNNDAAKWGAAKLTAWGRTCRQPKATVLPFAEAPF